MEKTWFRHFGYFSFALIFLSRLSVADTVQSVVVDVTMEIKNGNLAEAKSASEKKSFEMALIQVLPLAMDAEKKDAILKQPSSFVKNFQKIAEKQIGNQLISKYSVEVSIPSDESAPAPVTATATRFEIALTPKGGVLLSSDIVKFVSESWKLSVSNLRMSRGNIRFEVSLGTPTAMAEAQLAQFVAGRGTVRSFEVKPEPVADTGVLPLANPVPMPEGNIPNSMAPNAVAPNAVAPNSNMPGNIAPAPTPMATPNPDLNAPPMFENPPMPSE